MRTLLPAAIALSVPALLGAVGARAAPADDVARLIAAATPPPGVLTHGSEQFSLLSENAGRYAGLHALVAALGEDDGVRVQVCGNHASWRGKRREDFPDDVEVVGAAGATLSGYRDAGFVVIVM